MSKGRRYDGEPKLNYKKVFAVIIAIIVLVMSILMIKKILTKAKNTKPLEQINYFSLYQDEKWGILGSNGKIIIEPMYQEMPIVIDKQKDIFLCTYDIEEQTGEYKTKVINNKNEEIWTNYEKIEAIENYDKSGNIWYEENVLKVQKDGKWGLINLEGKEIKSPIYDNITALKGIKNSIIIEKDGLVGLVNNKAEEIINVEYAKIINISNESKNGYITVNKENKYGIINNEGQKILDNKYEEIKPIYSEKYYVIKENGKEQLIDKDEKTIIKNNFDEIKQIANSGVIIVKDNKYGLINFEENIIIEPKYENLEEINTDTFLAVKDGLAGIIDINQNEKVAFVYKTISYETKSRIYIAEEQDYKSTILDSNFEIKLKGILSEMNVDSGYMKLKTDEEYKYYNFKFEEKDIKDILVKNKIYKNKQDGKYGFIDDKGKTVVNYIYDDATELNEYGYAAVKKDGLWGAINSQGEIVIEPNYNLEENLVIDFIGKWHLGLDLNMNYYCDK